MSDDELVSVVVPCFNAQTILVPTLASALAQSHRALEIIVVDDGSTDGTVALARAEAERDTRIRVLSIENGGVANARNTGAAASRGAVIAFLDQDDLWHPDKIARQLAALRAGGPETGFVYTFYRAIDPEDRLLFDGPAWEMSGAVYLRSLLVNVVGNGSALLVRRAAFEQMGGYPLDLRRQGVEGVEDYLIQILLARGWAGGVVPQYLTGYRLWAGGMSRDHARVLASHLAMFDYLHGRFPETPADLIAAAKAALVSRSAMVELLARRRPVQAARLFARALRLAPGPAALVARRGLGPGLQGGLQRLLPRDHSRTPPSAPGRRFQETDPAGVSGEPPPHPLRERLAALAAQEAAFLRSWRGTDARAKGAHGPAAPAAAALADPSGP